MLIALSGRAIRYHTGGNSTYARALHDGLLEKRVNTRVLPSSRNPLANLLLENFAPVALSSRESVIHYTADTGLVRRFGNSAVVTTVHGIASLHVVTGRTAAQENIWRARVQAAISNSDLVVTVSETSKKDIVECFGVEPSRIISIHHGIEPKYFRSEKMSGDAQVLQQLLSLNGKPFALFVGNIEERKNVSNLVRAFQSEEVKSLGIRLVVAGKPAWNSESIVSELKAADNVIFLGMVSEEVKLLLLRSTACFIFPSRYEGFGFPILEAMASGAMVLTSDGGSLAEIKGPARTLEDISTAGIVSSVLKVFSNPSTEAELMEGQAWARGFSWENSVQAHIEVYADALEIARRR